MLGDPFDIIGTVVDGRYRIERVAGQGGFGVVYRAFHLGFEAPIALKVLKLPQHWSSVRREARVVAFQREGRMLFELSRLHPAIVRAFETGTLRTADVPTPYLSLEWLEGVSLDREMRHRRKNALPPLELDQVLTLLADPAAGLARAHAQGIAHRDIKPGNLFVNCSGQERRCKILDFGIAKLVSDDTEFQPGTSPEMTGTASFTPRYASPEQWSRRLGPTGPWTDVHAFALVCSELLSGRAPFAGEDSADLRASCLDERSRPTPATLGVWLTPAVEAVFSRALAFDPRERYRDVGALWQALCAAANAAPTPFAFSSFAWDDECARETKLTDRDARPTSVSAMTDSRATSMTCSREASASKQQPTRRTRLRLLSPALGLGLLGAVIFARVSFEQFFPPASAGPAKVWSAPPSVRPRPSVPFATSTLVSSLGASSSAITSMHQEAAGLRLVPPAVPGVPPASSKASPASHDRRGPTRAVRSNLPASPEPAPAPSESIRTQPVAPDIDLDDPGFVRRR